MARLPFFVSWCGNCHRSVEIGISKLGQSVPCPHCGGSFTANDPHNQSAAIDDPVNYWIRFTDHLYSKVEFEMIPGKNIERTPR